MKQYEYIFLYKKPKGSKLYTLSVHAGTLQEALKNAPKEINTMTKRKPIAYLYGLA